MWRRGFPSAASKEVRRLEFKNEEVGDSKASFEFRNYKFKVELRRQHLGFDF
jgi:hypothetical protein